jgi:hypothetical protein
MAKSSPKEGSRRIRAHCKVIQASLVAHLENQLAPEEQRRVDQHLNVCPRCTAERASLQKTLNLLSQRPLPEPDESFWMELRHGVRQGIREKEDISRVRPPFPARAWVPVVVVASLLVFLFLWWSRSPHPPVPGEGSLLAHLEQEGLRSLVQLRDDWLSMEEFEPAETTEDSLVVLLTTIPRPAVAIEQLLVREKMGEDPGLWETVIEEERAPESVLEDFLEDLSEPQLMELSSRLEKIIG